MAHADARRVADTISDHSAGARALCVASAICLMLGLYMHVYQLAPEAGAHNDFYAMSTATSSVTANGKFSTQFALLWTDKLYGECLGTEGAVPGAGVLRAKQHEANGTADVVWRVAVGLVRAPLHLPRSAWRTCYHGLDSMDTAASEPWLVLHAGSMIVGSTLASPGGANALGQQSRDLSLHASISVESSTLAISVHGMGTLALMSLPAGNRLTIPLHQRDMKHLTVSEHDLQGLAREMEAGRAAVETNDTFAATVLFDMRMEKHPGFTYPTVRTAPTQERESTAHNGVRAWNGIEVTLQADWLDVEWMGASLLQAAIPISMGKWLSVALCITVAPAPSQGADWSMVTVTVYLDGHLASPQFGSLTPTLANIGSPRYLSLRTLATENGDPQVSIPSMRSDSPHLRPEHEHSTGSTDGVGTVFLGRVVVTHGLMPPQGVFHSHRYMTLLQELRHASAMRAAGHDTRAAPNPSVRIEMPLWMPAIVSPTDSVVSVHAISLAVSIDRWVALEAAGRAQNITIARWLAADARNMTLEQAQEVDVSKRSYAHVRQMEKLGAFGCTLSHRALLSHLARTPAPPDAIHWIFEDDVLLPSSFTASWALIHADLITLGSEWDMISLGTLHSNVSAVPGLQVLMRAANEPNANLGTHAYAVRHGSLLHIVALLQYVATPIDVELVKHTLTGKLRRFDVPTLVQQLSELHEIPSLTNPRRNKKTVQHLIRP